MEKNCNYIRALTFCVENGIVLEQFEMEQLEYLYEGANIDIIKVGWAALKNFKKYQTQVNDLIDQRDFDGASKALQAMKKSAQSYQAQFNNIDASNVSSKTFGALASIGINALQALFPLTSKLGSIRDNVALAGNVAGKMAKYSAIGAGAAPAVAGAGEGITHIGRFINHQGQKIAVKGAQALGKNAKIAAGMSKAIKPLQAVSKVAKKIALPVTIIATSAETIGRTIKDYKQMQQDAKDGKSSDGNLFKNKILQLFKILDEQISVLDRYLKICKQAQQQAQNQPTGQQQQVTTRQQTTTTQAQQARPVTARR